MNSQENILENLSKGPDYVVTSPEEIRGQLYISKPRFEEEITKLESGDKSGIEYLFLTKQNLINHINAIEQKFGSVSKENKEIKDEALERLQRLDSILKKVTQ